MDHGYQSRHMRERIRMSPPSYADDIEGRTGDPNEDDSPTLGAGLDWLIALLVLLAVLAPALR